MFENIRNDLKAHGGDWGAQRFWALVVYRFGRWRYGVWLALLRKFFSLIYKILYKLIQIVTGIELPCEVSLGRNFVMDHFGRIIISRYASFGVGLKLWMRRSLSRRPGSDPPGMLTDFWRTSVLFQSGRKVRRRLEGRSVA